MRTINDLRHPVDLELDCYVHTKNANFHLETLSCLTAVRVYILHEIWRPQDIYPRDARFNGSPSEDVAHIISTNPGLKHLHLALMESDSSLVHWKFNETRERALEILGPKVSGLLSLTSLALMGEIYFTDKAWQSWDSTFRRLSSFCVFGVSLIHQFAVRLQGQLSNLQTLKLHIPYRDLAHHYDLESATVRAFLSGSNLSNLSILGLRPNLLPDLIQTCGRRLRTLHCHMDMTAPHQHLLPTMMSTANLQALQVACPILEYLSLDISRSDLPDAEGEFVSSKCNSATAASSSTTVSGMEPAATDQSLLRAIAAMSRLQQVRLLAQWTGPNTIPWTPVAKEVVIATYAYLQRYKCGLPLAKLEIYQYTVHPWTVQELGSRRAIVRYCETRTTETRRRKKVGKRAWEKKKVEQNWEIKEIWDLEGRTVLNYEATQKEHEFTQPCGEALHLFYSG